MTDFAEEFAKGFELVRRADEMVRNYLPIFERLNEYRNSGEPFTIMDIGEKMMPNGGYHAKYEMWNGQTQRTADAQSMTGRITSAVRSLIKEGLLTFVEVKDIAHPYIKDFVGVYYTDEKGNVLPDATIVTTPTGETYEVETKYLRGVRTCRGRIQKPVFKSYKQYRFVG